MSTETLLSSVIPACDLFDLTSSQVGVTFTLVSSAEKLGEKIRLARTDLGMTQAQLAAKIGVVESYISKIENGRLPYSPSTQTLRLLAKELQLDPLELLSLAEKAPDEITPALGDPSARGFFSVLRNSSLSRTDWQELERFLRDRMGKHHD
jgi:transcriptional regulator with XRE-family HTH domain